MTGKLNKDIIALIYASVLTGIALVYGFMSVPAPSNQRQITLDHRRVSDLGELQASLTNYYTTNHQLPGLLDQVTDNTYNGSGVLNKQDPETHEPYEYQVTGALSYTLCATFTTNSLKEDPSQYDSYDDNNYDYASFKNTFKHGIGKTCFPLRVNNYLYNTTNSELSYPQKGAQIMNVPAGSTSAGNK